MAPVIVNIKKIKREYPIIFFERIFFILDPPIYSQILEQSLYTLDSLYLLQFFHGDGLLAHLPFESPQQSHTPKQNLAIALLIIFSLYVSSNKQVVQILFSSVQGIHLQNKLQIVPGIFQFLPLLK